MEQITKFKEVMGNYPTGVTVLTMMTDEGVPLGLTVNSFASVSLDPLLILWSIDKNVSTHDLFVNSKKFAVNVLAANQSELCFLFATRDVDRFANCNWETSVLGLPVLDGVSAVLQCENYQAVDAGDHTILIGKVVAIDGDNREPLLYHRRHTAAIPPSFYQKK